jgi:TRAP-type transport system periplasmic protein
LRLRRSILVMGVALTIVGVTACGGSAAGDGQTQTISMGTTSTEDSQFGAAMQAFEEEVESRTDGEVQVNLGFDSAYGGEREMVEAVSIGTLEAVMTSNAVITNFVPEMGVLDLPFVFEDTEHAREVMNGEVGEELAGLMEEQNLRLLAWGETGFRHITSANEPILEPEDLQGVAIRVMENDIHLQAFEAMGANPTPMAWGEVYTSLQQGVIDAQENPIGILWVNNLDEVQDHASLTGHVYSAGAIILSSDIYESLSPEHQEAVNEAAVAAQQANYEYIDEKEPEYIRDLESRGMQFHEVDREAFAQATDEVVQQHRDISPELYEKIVDAR